MGECDEDEDEREEAAPTRGADTTDLVIELQAGDEGKEIVVRVGDVVAATMASKGPRSH